MEHLRVVCAYRERLEQMEWQVKEARESTEVRLGKRNRRGDDGVHFFFSREMREKDGGWAAGGRGHLVFHVTFTSRERADGWARTRGIRAEFVNIRQLLCLQPPFLNQGW